MSGSPNLPQASSVRRHLPFRLSLIIGLAVGGTVLARFMSTITQVLLAQLMGVEIYGIYTALYALLSPAVIAASLGLDMWLLRQGGYTKHLDSTISHVLTLRTVVLSGLLLLVVPWVWWQHPEWTLRVIGLAALGLLWDLLVTTADSALRAQLRSLAATVLQLIVAALLLLLIWIAWSSDQPLLATVTYRLISTGAGMLGVWWLFRSQLQLRWQPREWVRIIKEARVYFASELLANIVLKADLTLIALLIGATATAFYMPALTIINTTFLVPNVTAQILLPMISRQPYGSHMYRLAVGASVVASIAYGVFWIITLTWGAPWLIQLLYGAEYAAAVPLLRIMCVVPLLKSLNFCWTTLMIAHNHQVLRTKLQLFGAAFNTIGNLICIPHIGIIGAAWINLGTEIVLFGCYGYGAYITSRRERLQQ